MLKDLVNVYGMSGFPIDHVFGPIGISQMGRGESAIALSLVAQLQHLFFDHKVDS